MAQKGSGSIWDLYNVHSPIAVAGAKRSRIDLRPVSNNILITVSGNSKYRLLGLISVTLVENLYLGLATSLQSLQ